MWFLRALAAFLLLAAAGCAPPAATVAPLFESRWHTVQGEERSLRSMLGEKATVFITMDPDCPICQLYTADFQAIADAYGPKGVRVVGLYSGPFMERETARAFSAAGTFGFPQVMDSACTLTLALQARVTPECFVAGPDGKVMYRGALDDRPVRQGRKQLQARQTWLADALDNFLATGRPQPEVMAVGCIVECDDE